MTRHGLDLDRDGDDVRMTESKHQQLIQALNLQPTNDDDFPLESLLSVGSVVGEGVALQEHVVSKVQLDLPPRVEESEESEPAPTFEVVRKLGTGSYAVVWLVREIVPSTETATSSPPLSAQQPDDDNIFDFDELSSSSSSTSSSSPHSPTSSPTTSNSSGHSTSSTIRREFALKCLSKADLDKDGLAAQLLEANIHQSLPVHPNIVTLYRTLETPAYLLLLLEFVPGQDLFYFLESARDSLSNNAADYTQSGSLSKTPTTPSLLSSTSLLSQQRLRLIASMFGQMCLAVAACHQQGVYHRDIKPENFIVTESQHPDPERHNERRVVVKLTDFGLATRDSESYDMDCGSAPYMSFECRNNLAPSYRPQPADIWSLGIVFINMLYHHNPWSDTSLQPEFRCPSFDSYRHAPNRGAWFEGRFKGIGAGENEVGGWLARKVFCFLDEECENSGIGGETPNRVTAEEFGKWSKDLPMILGRKALSYQLAPSVSSLSIERVGRSRRPSLRSVNGVSWIGFGPRRPESTAQSVRSAVMGHHRRPSVGPPPLGDPDIDNLNDAEFERELESLSFKQEDDQSQYGDEVEVEGESHSRAASATRRRKRGARNKSKTGTSTHERDHSLHGERDREDDTESMVSSITGTGTGIDKLDDMAVKSQLLARELSNLSSYINMSSGNGGSRSRISLPQSETEQLEKDEEPAALPPLKKKGWKGLWSRTSSETLSAAFSSSSSSSSAPPVPPLPNTALSGQTATNVANLVLGLNAKTSTSVIPSNLNPARTVPTRMPRGPGSKEDGFARGRKTKTDAALKPYQSSPGPWSPQPRVEFVPRPSHPKHPNPHNRSNLISPDGRTQSPSWRNSVSTQSTTSTGFTRYSNGSARSLETVATSASGASNTSWRDRNPAATASGPGGTDKPSDSPHWKKSKTAGPTSESETTQLPPTPTSATSATSAISSTSSSRLETSSTATPVRRPNTAKSARSNTPLTARNLSSPAPANIKVMNGVPWELTQMPWQLHQRPSGDISQQVHINRPSPKFNKGRVPPASVLDTISEQPSPSQAASWRAGRQSPTTALKTTTPILTQRMDASTSTTDLTEPTSPSAATDDSGEGRRTKSQNNPLHKIFSTLRR